MRQFELERRVLGKIIRAQVLLFDVGVHVSLTGGQLSHIGAVSIISPEGLCDTTQFPGHKDGVISEQWALALAQRGFYPAVVEVGIHYDALNSNQVDDIVASTDDMLPELFTFLEEAKKINIYKGE